MPPTLPTLLEATLKLTFQFTSTLSTPLPPQSLSDDNKKDKPPAPLPLLSTSATALKAQTTKLSLLAINQPFTPSAVITVLTAVNETILPSLVTAALLTIPAEYTQAFHTEAELLVKDVLREFGSLIGIVKEIARSDGQNVVVTEQQKAEVMSATGRTFKGCEQLVTFAEEGVVGFVAGKARQYLELVRDGMRELEEWDPEEEGDEGDDMFWGDGGDDGDDGGFGKLDKQEDEKGAGKGKGKGKAKATSDDEDEDGGDVSIATLSAEKSHLLRLLTPLSKIYPAIITHRLKPKKNTPSSSKNEHPDPLTPHLDRLIQHLRDLPNLLDEAAGALYDHDIENAHTYTTKLCNCAFLAAKVAIGAPQVGTGDEGENEEGKGDAEQEKGKKAAAPAADEDKFPKWAETWMKVVGEIAKSRAN
ncbi:hypothetical protein AJ79_03576 [Helicocarpus griseus UAMH5409]|uniref:Cyclin-D1-binding protein 1-like N-terminal domain-containing protein n=1 Tax=Helicocarpus griseus UAMH5409 TaxID=1447875 RepID=A0A2B7XXR8_9EURO|nr:hypothetical protein AJ79_03576 [Helicocarpus griseus UAMH5409]